MSVVVPNAVALAGIVDGSSIVASDHRNNYSAVQVGVNGLIAMFTAAPTKGDLIVSAGGGSFDKLAVGANGQTVVADSTQPLGVKWAAGSGMAVICDQVLVGSQASFDTNTILGGNIPSTYSHLRLMVYSRGDAAVTNAAVLMRFNNDSAGNYDYQFIRGFAGTNNASEAFAQTSCQIGIEPGASAGASLFSQIDASIQHYANAVGNKTLISQYAMKYGVASTDMEAGQFAGFWRSNAAITRITILPAAAANFVAGSRFTLYGLS